jgi:hypothetical protein
MGRKVKTSNSQPNGEEPLESVPPSLTDLEPRVRRLEEAVAVLQDCKPLEDRIVERVSEQLNRNRSHPVRDTTSLIIEAGRQLLPTPLEPPNQTAPPALPGPRRRSWFLLDLLAEARAILRMFVDPRYRMGWAGRTIPLVLIALILTSSFWMLGTGLPLGVGTVIDKTLDLVLAFVLFKILAYEARRYRETSPDLPPSMRL